MAPLVSTRPAASGYTPLPSQSGASKRPAAAAATAAASPTKAAAPTAAVPQAEAAKADQGHFWPVRVVLFVFAVLAWPFLQVANLVAKAAHALAAWWSGPERHDVTPQMVQTPGQPVTRPRAPKPPLDLSTPEKVATAREAYLERMARPGTWGDNLELLALASLHQVHIEVWHSVPQDGVHMLECKGIVATDAAQPRGTVAVFHHNGHYQGLVAKDGDHLAKGSRSYVGEGARATQGERRAMEAFKSCNVRGRGDCMFLAVAFAVGVPLVREFTWALDRYTKGGEDRPGFAEDCNRARTYLGAAAAEDAAVLAQAVDALAAAQRAQVVAELRRAKWQDLVDAQLVAEHSDS